MNMTTNSPEYYDTIASGYDELHGEEQLKKLKIIETHLNISSHMRVLDVGCGTGLSTAFINLHNCSPNGLSIGLDPSHELLKIARSKNKALANRAKNQSSIDIQYIQGAAENLPFKAHSFDILISVTALHNFENVDEALSEINRVSKTKVQIILTVLKRSKKGESLKSTIMKQFKVREVIEEDKDWILVISKNDGGD